MAPLCSRKQRRRSPGKLHAKCAVIDETVLVGSANLTDDAFNRNMEMGLATTDARLSDQLVAHFRELQSAGILQAVTRRGGALRAFRIEPKRAPQN